MDMFYLGLSSRDMIFCNNRRDSGLEIRRMGTCRGRRVGKVQELWREWGGGFVHPRTSCCHMSVKEV